MANVQSLRAGLVSVGILFLTGCIPGLSSKLPPAESTVMPQYVSDAITTQDLAVIINENDPQSVEVGNYYQTKRGIPEANMIRVRFSTSIDTLPSAEFNTIKQQVDAKVPSQVQGYALTWTRPFRVDCMSITSAFAHGFNSSFCSNCGYTTMNTYFNSESKRPYADYGFRPAMMLAGASVSDVLNLIDRSVPSDGTHPNGTAYLITTTDAARSARAFQFQPISTSWDPSTGVKVNWIDNTRGTGLNYIEGKTDVLIYLLGLTTVPSLLTNTFLPGALADHLTSYGGFVPTSSQMSAVKFLEAGAAASYGTVVEPCAISQKFPNAQILIPRYYMGDSALEAYWKSVQMVGEGLFIGEPLARPFSDTATFVDGAFEVRTNSMMPNVKYHLEGAEEKTGTYEKVGESVSVASVQKVTFRVASVKHLYYRIKKD